MNNEKRNRRLTAILFIIFFILVWECTGQVKRIKRYKNYPEITTILPVKAMKFNTGNNDTIYVSISADSVEADYYDIKLFVFFPKSKSIKDYSVEIGFPNGKWITLTADITVLKYNYSEYYISEDALERLQMMKFDYISFNKDTIVEPCVNIRTKDFFCNFLQHYK